MKINFGDYTWFGDLNDKRNITYNAKDPTQKEFESKQFNDDYFNQLISNRQYEDAANYANQFHFNDPKMQRAHLNDIANLRRNGRILASCYNKIHDTQTLNKVEFFDKVFVNGGLETLENNKYANKFIEAKRKLCSRSSSINEVIRELCSFSSIITETDNKGVNSISKFQEATKLEVTFQPKVQKFLGIDWLAKDNDKNIDNFYTQSGLNERALKAQGVKVINKDGRTTLRFDESNPLANKIIYNLPRMERKGDTPIPQIGGNIDVSIVVLDSKNRKIKNLNIANRLNEFQDIIDSAKNTKEQYFKQNDLTEKQYSSTVAGNIDDNLAMLQEALKEGSITQQEFNKQYSINCGYIDSVLRNIGSGNYEMYSNKFNEETSDETLNPVDDKKRNELINAITATNKANVHLSSMISNGKIGTLVELDAAGLTSKQQENLEGTDDDQLSNGRRIQIFIPGLFQEQAQEKINRNTSSQAIQEANSMQDFDYDYKTQDGKTLTYDGLGGYIYDGEQIDKDNAVKIINKDLIIQDAVNNLQFYYLNKDDKLIDKTNYENKARELAIKACNDIDPGVPLSYTDGTPLTEDEVFAHSKANPDDVYFGKIQYQVYDKLQNLYDVYNALMDAISYYN